MDFSFGSFAQKQVVTTHEIRWQKTLIFDHEKSLHARLRRARRRREFQETAVRVAWSPEGRHVLFYRVDDEVFTTGTLKHDDNIVDLL